MNRKLKKLIAGIMFAGMLATASPLGTMVSWAAEAKIAFSDPSVMVGNDVTVTMKVTSDSALGTAEIMLAYDPSVLEFVSGTNANGGAGAIKVLGTMESADQKAFNFTLKFKTLQAGNTVVSVTSQEIYDVDSQIVTLSKQGNSTVKVTSPATYSKDAALKSLKISPGTLTPAFSADTLQYTAEVDANTTSLVVNAVAANAGANVSLSGDKDLKAGENNVVIKVTAEDGQTTKTYTISVTKPEGGDTVSASSENGETVDAEFGDTTVTINGTDYSIATSFDETTLPEGFEIETYQYKGTDVMAGKGLEKDLLLLYLKDSGGNGGFYIYNEEADSWSQFVQVETSSKAIIIVPLDSDTTVPEGFQERQVDIDGKQVTGWVANSESDPEYCLFYAMNWNGEKNFYRYDLSEKTIQRYFASGVSNEKYVAMANTYNRLTRDYRIQFYLLIAVSLVSIALFVLVILLLRKGRPPRGEKTEGRSFKKSKEINDTNAYYEEPEETAPVSKVKRYTREEFDQEALIPSTEISDDTNLEEDDFIFETSLEDMEKSPDSKEDDDFEFFDLND